MTTSTTTYSTNTTASNESIGASTKLRQLENFTGSAAEHTTGLSEHQARFTCFLATKSGKLCQYELALCPSANRPKIQIISSSKQKVKSTLDLATIHAKETPKQPRAGATSASY